MGQFAPPETDRPARRRGDCGIRKYDGHPFSIFWINHVGVFETHFFSPNSRKRLVPFDGTIAKSAHARRNFHQIRDLKAAIHSLTFESFTYLRVSFEILLGRPAY